MFRLLINLLQGFPLFGCKGSNGIVNLSLTSRIYIRFTTLKANSIVSFNIRLDRWYASISDTIIYIEKVQLGVVFFKSLFSFFITKVIVCR